MLRVSTPGSFLSYFAPIFDSVSSIVFDFSASNDEMPFRGRPREGSKPPTSRGNGAISKPGASLPVTPSFAVSWRGRQRRAPHLHQCRDYFIERHGVESFTLFFRESATRGRTSTKELVICVKDSSCVRLLAVAQHLCGFAFYHTD
jgi:hypothetical protein